MFVVQICCDHRLRRRSVARCRCRVCHASTEHDDEDELNNGAHRADQYEHFGIGALGAVLLVDNERHDVAGEEADTSANGAQHVENERNHDARSTQQPHFGGLFLFCWVVVVVVEEKYNKLATNL